MRVDAIARWLADLAYLDLIDAGLVGDGVWLVRRSRILVERFPRFGEEVRLRTFCSGIGRFSAERRTTISGGQAAVEAVAVWVWLDAESGRPIRFPSEFVDLYGESAAGRDANVRLRHPDPPDHAERLPWRFRATDIDIAGHVNNSNYLAPLEEELAGAEPDGLELEIEYREPAGAGDAVIARDGDRRWLIGADHAVFASLLVKTSQIRA